MKKNEIFSMLAGALCLGFVACNNEGDSTATNDSTVTTETATTTNEYAARADSFRVNSEAGNYLDAKTGKQIKINVDPQTGTRVNAETNEPVWRYVDRRNWWVYGPDSWEPIGEARMDNNSLMYKGDNDAWLDYQKRWPNDDQEMKEWKLKMDEDGSYKLKSDDTKIKVDEDGDTKIKTDDKKIKKDEDGIKVKKDN